MNIEADLLKKDLSAAETKDEIQKVVEDAELLGHEDIAELARAKLQALSSSAEKAATTSPSQVAQVERMEGSMDETLSRTKAVDQEIGEVVQNAQREIKAVEDAAAENKGEVEPSSESAKEDEISTEAKEFLDNEEKYGPHGSKEALINFLRERHPDLHPGTEAYREAWSNIVLGIRYDQFQGSRYAKMHPEISFSQYTSDMDRLKAFSEFADQVEGAKGRERPGYGYMDFVHIKVKGDKGTETITLDLENPDTLDNLDDATKAKILSGIREQKDRMNLSSKRLAILLEKGIITPADVGDLMKEGFDLTQLFTAENIKRLQEDPKIAKRIQGEIESLVDKIVKLKDRPEETELTAAYFARLLKVGLDSPDIQIAFLKHGIKSSPKQVLEKRLEETSKHDSPVTSNRFTANDLASFARAGVISHEQLLEIAKRDIGWHRDHGVDSKGKDPAYYRNTERHFGEAIGEAYTYKHSGLISQEEVDQLLAY